MSEAADAVLERCADKWRSEQRVLTEMVIEAARTKTALPNNYWHDEYMAHQKLQIAEVLAQELK